MTITLEQHNSIPSIQDIDGIDNWVMVFSSPLKRKKFPYQEKILKRFKKLSQKEKNGFPVVIDLPNKNLSHVSFAMLDSNVGSFDLFTLARKLVSVHALTNPKKVGLFVFGFSKKESERVAEALISAALATSATMPVFKSKKQKRTCLLHLQ